MTKKEEENGLFVVEGRGRGSISDNAKGVLCVEIVDARTTSLLSRFIFIQARESIFYFC